MPIIMMLAEWEWDINLTLELICEGREAAKGSRYVLIIHELLVAMGFFPAGVQDEIPKEESQRLAS